MISALDSGASAQGSGPAGDIVSCSWVCHFTVTVPLSKEVYKWVPENFLLRGYLCDGLASHPGSRNDNRDKPRPDESFSSYFLLYRIFTISLAIATRLKKKQKKTPTELPTWETLSKLSSTMIREKSEAEATVLLFEESQNENYLHLSWKLRNILVLKKI